MTVTVYTEQGQQLLLATEVGHGGEGAIYASPRNRLDCAKVYHKSLSQEDRRKLELMVQNPPRDPAYDARKHRSIAWPSALLYKDSSCSQWAGFLMPAVNTKAFQKAIFYMDSSDRSRLFGGGFNWKYLYTAGFNFVSSVAAIHEKSYCIGDINESNVLVAPNALITLIDCDSFQVPDYSCGKIYRCPVGKPEYTAPELQGKYYPEVDRTPETDCFALAVLLFELLMEGTHPYQAKGRLVEDCPSTQAKIVRGHFAYTMGDRNVAPPDHAPPFDILHPEIQQLFHRCFVDGHQKPQARPTALEWFETLKRLANRFRQCAVNQNHMFLDHLNTCPWCQIAKSRGKDLFLSPVGQQIALDDPSTTLDSLDKRLGYLHNYVVMALSDGILTTEEESYLHELGSKLQIPPKEIEKAIQTEAKRVKARTSSSGGGTPKIEISKSQFEFHDLHVNAGAQGSFTISNTGGGTLQGPIKSNRAWLKPLQSQIDTAWHRQEISFQVDTTGLPLGVRESGEIEVQSNGGTEFVRVNISVEVEKKALTRFAWSLAAGGFVAGGFVGAVLCGALGVAPAQTAVAAYLFAWALGIILAVKRGLAAKEGKWGGVAGAFFGGAVAAPILDAFPPVISASICCGLAYGLLLAAFARQIFVMRQKGAESLAMVIGSIGMALALVLVALGAIVGNMVGNRPVQQTGQSPPGVAPATGKMVRKLGKQRTSPRASALPIPGAAVAYLKFFESASGFPPKNQRAYGTRFPRQTSRYINWELGVTNPSPSQRIDFRIEAHWYGPDRSEMARQTTDTYVLPGWTWSEHHNGWGRADGGHWTPGSYRVDLYVRNRRVATGRFHIN